MTVLRKTDDRKIGMLTLKRQATYLLYQTLAGVLLFKKSGLRSTHVNAQNFERGQDLINCPKPQKPYRLMSILQAALTGETSQPARLKPSPHRRILLNFLIVSIAELTGVNLFSRMSRLFRSSGHRFSECRILQ